MNHQFWKGQNKTSKEEKNSRQKSSKRTISLIRTNKGYSSKKIKMVRETTSKGELIRAEKWKKFLRYRRFFSLIPFLDFVIVAGSLAFGKVHENSDFDVIIGAKSGRIFTVRFFAVALFGLLGIRRKGIDHKIASKNKICLNHFVTEASYRLSPPHDIYWQKLYQNLEPVYGNGHAVELFFRKNRDWCSREEIFLNRNLWQETKSNSLRKISELILRGSLGNAFERFAKKIQLNRIQKSLKRDTGYKPRLRYDDEELEFHPDTKRIETIISDIHSKALDI